MLSSPALLARLSGRATVLEAPGVATPANQRDPAVVATVSAMLSTIEAGGIDAVHRYATELDRHDGRETLVAATDLTAGRFPLTASAFMAVGVAERQLSGLVAIDLPAGSSEVAVIADDNADPAVVAADLLGQAEHGPTSPAALVTTSRALGRAVLTEVDRQLATLATAEIAGAAWRDHGSVLVAADREAAAQLMDDLAPEHLEVITDDDGWYHDRLRCYGSIFLGPWSTVAYSDKGMAGTNHTLPTAGGARHTSGLSVSTYLKAMTYQRITREATPEVAPAVVTISESEGMAAHAATAALRLERLADAQT